MSVLDRIYPSGSSSPIWLGPLGIPAPIPNLDGVNLLSHLAWGASLGVLTVGGYDRVVL